MLSPAWSSVTRLRLRRYEDYLECPCACALSRSARRRSGTEPRSFASSTARHSHSRRKFWASISERAVAMMSGVSMPPLWQRAWHASVSNCPTRCSEGRTPLPKARSPNPFVSPQDWGPQIAWLAGEAAEAIGAVRRHLAGKPRAFVTALLPLALVEPYFRALQKAGHEPARDIVEIAPLARLWRIAWAHWTGRL